jgi:uncharacterized protein YjdB
VVTARAAAIVVGLTLAVGACGGSPTGADGIAHVRSLTIAPTDSHMKVGESLHLSMSVEMGPGAIPPLPSPLWSSTNPGVVTVDLGGVATARTIGDAIVVVQFGEKSATSRITVEP